jgi:hypothetical protein
MLLISRAPQQNYAQEERHDKWDSRDVENTPGMTYHGAESAAGSGYFKTLITRENNATKFRMMYARVALRPSHSIRPREANALQVAGRRLPTSFCLLHSSLLRDPYSNSNLVSVQNLDP